MKLAEVRQERDFGGEQSGGQFIRTQIQDFKGLHVSNLRWQSLELRSIGIHTADFSESTNVSGELTAKRIVANLEKSQVRQRTQARIVHDLQVGNTDSIEERIGRQVRELAEDGIIGKMQVRQLSERREGGRDLLECILVEMKRRDGDASTHLRRHLDNVVASQNDSSKSATVSNRSREGLKTIFGDNKRLKIDKVTNLTRKLLERVIRDVQLGEVGAIRKFLRELFKLIPHQMQDSELLEATKSRSERVAEEVVRRHVELRKRRNVSNLSGQTRKLILLQQQNLQRRHLTNFLRKRR